MASVTVRISSPLLDGGEKFIERHRLLPLGAFSSFTDRTNAPFTVTGLVDGTYQFEISFVKADGTICPPVFKTYDVIGEEPEVYECPEFTVTQEIQPARLKIEYTTGTGVPTCGYKVEYRTATGGYIGVTYAVLPASPFYVTLPLSDDLIVRITANQCNGSVICFEDDVPEPPIAPCTPMTDFEYLVVPSEEPMQKRKKYTITLTATQSSTPTTSAVFTIEQGFTLAPAVQWTGAFPRSGISPTAFSQTFVVYHNFPYGAPTPPVYWVIKFNDACGTLHNIIVDYP